MDKYQTVSALQYDAHDGSCKWVLLTDSVFISRTRFYQEIASEADVICRPVSVSLSGQLPRTTNLDETSH